MDTALLRTQSREELISSLAERRERVEALVWSLRRKKAKNVKELSGVRKDIARILTILGQLPGTGIR